MSTKQSVGLLLKKFAPNRELLLPILHVINDVKGYIDLESMELVAKYLNISPTEIFGIATFYHFLNTEKKGKFIIRVCKSITCDLKNKNKIIKQLESELKISLGETTKDSLFSLETTNCMGMCDLGPSMIINDKIYSKLTPKKVQSIISQIKKEHKGK